MKKLFMFLSTVAFLAQAHAVKDEDLLFTVNNESEERFRIYARIKIRDLNALRGQSPVSFHSFKMDVVPDELKSYKRSDLGNILKLGVSIAKIMDIEIARENGSLLYVPFNFSIGSKLTVTGKFLQTLPSPKSKVFISKATLVLPKAKF